jgi:putative restriction endonuclease
MDSDLTIREAAVRHARLLSLTWGDAVPASELSRGFVVGDRRVHLVAWGRGVFKPKELMDGPLTLVSSLASSYEDEHLDDDLLLYDYAPSGSDDWANDGLKRLASLGRPVILLRQVKKKPFPEYMVFAPVVIAASDDVARKFRLSLSAASIDASGVPAPIPSVFSKAYAETVVKARLHQAHFRRETLRAYGNMCCVCQLAERGLLDAAHIVADRLPEGLATVTNGMSMCPTHHRAFDKDLLLVNPEYRVQIARDRLEQAASDATARMLLDFDGREVHLPKALELRPRAEFLRRKIELAA